MKIIYIGDIVAEPGRKAVKAILPKLIKEHAPDYIFANAENLAHGRGVTRETINEMLEAGIDYFTSGDHLFWQKGSEDIIDDLPILRPANYPGVVAGIGHKLIQKKGKGSVLLMNLMGRTFLNERLDDPFTKADELLALHEGEKPECTIVDFHAESTSEKHVMGFYLDGRVNAVVGTHTHVPSCDNRLFPKGTMYVTDLGMTGNIDSVLGVKKEIITQLYLTALPQRFEWEDTGKKAFRSVILDIKLKTIERLDFTFE